MAEPTKRNVFVLGMDEANHEALRAIPDARSITFHRLLTQDELQEGEVDVLQLLDKAVAQLEAFDGTVDAIVTYWDFPATMMVPILCERYGLPSADLAAVVRCEHKYWSRLDQRKVITELPAFGLLDLDATEARLPDGVTYPAWVKPVESASSEGAYHVADAEQLAEVLPRAREEVGRMGRPFEDILAMLDLPPEIAEIGGTAYMAEEAVGGQQMTVEGFSRGGKVEIYGVVDSVSYPERTSFLRYQYPSQAPPLVQDHMAEVSRQVIGAAGLDHSTFNIEFFWDPETERLRLLEVNARHSQSHAAMFEMVDGVPNHHAMVSLALGGDPHLPRRQGPFAMASKWFLRHFSDGVVRRVPTAQEIADLEHRLRGVTVEVLVEEGARLSDGYGEDSYSFALAEVHIGGDDEDDLAAKYARFLDALPFEIDDDPEES